MSNMGGNTYFNQDRSITTHSGPRYSSSNAQRAAHSGYEMLDIEIDMGWDACSSAECCPRKGHNIPLYKIHEIPSFLSGNPYVVSGYRVKLPFSLCCRSLFVWSNETVNIWTHLIGLVVLWLLMLHDNLSLIPDMGGSLADHAILSLGLLSYQFGLVCSAGYHLFHCHSERAYHRWLALDLAGISVALLGCYLPAVYYAFYCLWVWKDVYLVVISVLFTAVLIFQTSPNYLSPHRTHRRLVLYVGLVAYGLIPTVHWILLQGGLDTHIVQVFIPKVAVMYLLGTLAFFFYISKFPERCFPGWFDFIGSSHQWWHVIVVIAFLWWRRAGLDILHYRLNQTCLPL